MCRRGPPMRPCTGGHYSGQPTPTANGAAVHAPNFSSLRIGARTHACPQKLLQRRRARAGFSGSTHWMSERQTFLVQCSGSKLSEAIPRAAGHAKLFQRMGTQASAKSCSDSTHAPARGCTKSTSREGATTHNCSQTAMLREYFWEVAETPNFRLPQAMSARARTSSTVALPRAARRIGW